MNAYPELDSITRSIIGCAVIVHKEFGPGVFERVYETFLAHELRKKRHEVEQQVRMTISYDGITMEGAYRMDMVVDSAVVLEIKAVEELRPVHHAQLLSYLRLSGYHVGLLINFHEKLLTRGVKRIVL